MSGCDFPEHHGSGRGGALITIVTVCIVAAVVLTAFHLVMVIVAWLVSMAWLALLPIGAGVALLAYRPLLFAWHLARAGRSGLRYAMPAMWAGLRWRWVARNCQLAYIDHHRRRTLRPRLPFTTAVRVNPETKPLERWPAARFRVHEHGWTARVRTIPKVGREELSEAAPWIRDAWRCERVMVTQARAGRVDIRGMRRDLLAEPYPLTQAPAEVYATRSAAPPRRLYLGRDVWAEHRWANLANLPAVLVAGLTGYGKTTLLTQWLGQLLASPAVQLAGLFDLKGSADFLPWEPFARIVTGDDLPAVADGLADIHHDMTTRLGSIHREMGVRNVWRLGVSSDWPLKLTIVDEASTAMDLDSRKGDRTAEQQVRQIRYHLSELARKGRSIGMLTVIASQTVTTDSVPGILRDNIPLAVSFAAKTTDKSAAALGPTIRDYPDLCPTSLLDGRYRGAMVAQLRTGLDPYTMLRCPEITEQAAEARAAELAPKPKPRLHVVPELEEVPA